MKKAEINKPLTSPQLRAMHGALELLQGDHREPSPEWEAQAVRVIYELQAVLSAQPAPLAVVMPELHSKRKKITPASSTPSLSVSVEEAARLTNHSRSGIYEVIASGDLKAFKLGRRRLILVTELKAWIERVAKDGAR